MSARRMSRLGCRDCRRQFRLDRRGFLKMGLLGSTGLSLPQLLRHEARTAQAGNSGRLPSVIILWMRGGPSHIDMWDPKPDAPAEYRGEFGVRPTKVPGILLSDMLPMCGRIMDKWSIVRSLHHHDAGHSTGDQICFTGYPSGPNPDENVYPSCGSIVSRQLGHLTPQLPAYVMIPRMVPGTGSAYLGVAHKPFETQADPATARPVPRAELRAAGGHHAGARRRPPRSCCTSFDQLRRDVDATGQMDALDRFQQKAWDILTSPAARDAFDLDREPAACASATASCRPSIPKASNRCGAPAWSQRMLLARRLVEAGVRLVTVDLRWWDTHVKGFESLRLGFLPRFDRAYSGADRGPGAARSAVLDAGDRLGRVRPHAARQRRRRPRSLSQRLQRGPGRRPGQGRPGRRRIRRQGRLPARPIPRRRRTCWPRCINISASTPAAIPQQHRPAHLRAAQRQAARGTFVTGPTIAP